MVVLNRIYTKTGDAGETALGNGARVAKHSTRVEAYGTVDETNATVGLARLHAAGEIDEALARIQNDLFDLGGALSMPEKGRFASEKLAALDSAIEHYNAGLPPLKEFILPGGSRAAAQCHVARSVARRAERDLATSGKAESSPANALPYINRLSDLLFVLSRTLNQVAGHPEVLWKKR